MDKCDICGERIDWDNPNIHYGGHTCDTETLDKLGARERYVGSMKQPYEPKINIPKEEPAAGVFIANGPVALHERPNWHKYFMAFAEVARQRSTCLRRTVGAVITVDNNVVATGYNGAPKGVPHCGHPSVGGCLREKMNVPSGQRAELCRGTHAEQNAIIQAAVQGRSVAGGTLYCTNQPCSICAKMIINAGIARVIVADGYADELAVSLLSDAGVHLERLKPDGGIHLLTAKF